MSLLFRRSLASVVTAWALLSACSPLGALGSAAPTAAPAPNPEDLQVTVQAQVQATVQALPTPGEPDEAPGSPTPQNAASTPTDALGEQTSAPVTQPTSAPAKPTQAANTGGAGLAPNDPSIVVVGANGSVSWTDGVLWSSTSVVALGDGSCDPAYSKPGVDASGTFWFNCGRTVRSANDMNWEQSEEQLRGLVFGPQGQVASLDTSEIKILKGGSWTSYRPAATTGEEAFPSRAGAFAPDGTLWVAGNNSNGSQLVSFDGSSWKGYQQAGPEYMSSLLVTAKGELIGATNYFYRFDGTQFTEIIPRSNYTQAFKSGGGANVERMVEAPNGDILAATDIGIVTLAGTELRLRDQNDGLPSSDVRDIALDDKGNIWAATSHGLATLVDGTWQATLPSTSGLAEADLVGLLVRGAPGVPAPSPHTKTATIEGQVTKDGQPAAGVLVELCVQVGIIRDANRGMGYCDKQLDSQQDTTNAEGNYRFSDVPLGNYAIVVTIGDRVSIPTSLEIKALRPNETVPYNVKLSS